MKNSAPTYASSAPRTRSSPPAARDDLDGMSRAELLEQAFAEEEYDRRLEIARCMAGHDGLPGALYWVREHTETFCEQWKEVGFSGPYQRFPDRPYFPWLFRHFVEDRRL